MRKGALSLETLVTIVIVIIVMIGLLLLWQRGAFAFGKELQECRADFCAAQCGVMTDQGMAGTSIGNDAWCAQGLWVLDDTRAAEYEGTEANQQVSGHDLGLQCCQLLVPEAPASYIPKSMRVGETDRTDRISTPPRFSFYFANRPNPIASGGTIEAVSGRDYEIIIDLSNMKEKDGGFIATDGGKDIKDAKTVHCTVSLLDSDGNNIFEITEDDPAYTTDFKIAQGEIQTYLEKPLCEFTGEEKLSVDTTVSFPSVFEGQSLTLVITMSEEKGRYDPFSRYQAQYKVTFDISDEIKFLGLTNEWTFQRTITAYCVDEECINYAYGIKEGNECTYLNTATVERGRGKITINQPGSHIICVQAESASGKYLYSETDIPINIEHTQPNVSIGFNALTNEITIRCEEPRDTQSGCAVGAGIYFVHDLNEFFLGECSQMNSNYRWYAGVRDGENVEVVLPYNRPGAVSRVCVRVQDEAGNIAYDNRFVYDARTIALETIAGWIN